MSEKEILLLGNPQLYEVSLAVSPEELDEIEVIVQDLHDTLMAFRAKYGVGRAIAAPQIGIKKRLIYMHIDQPVVLINPRIVNLSEDVITLWDDCMSFPDFLVRVSRHKSMKIIFRDLQWNEHSLELDGDLSELLQHEYDHLDGILAFSRAIDAHSFALRSALPS
ncbi:MAG: peptide deformylase [Candidatus Kariarchaeaceae archaeon]